MAKRAFQQQLALPVTLSDDATFTNFYRTPDNQITVSLLQSFLQQTQSHFIYLFGQNQAGLTHLTQALCQQTQSEQQTVFYCSLRHYQEFEVSIFNNLESFTLVCLEDLDAIIGNSRWEEAVFHCYNRLWQAKRYLLVTAHAKPQAYSFHLPDLASRMSAGLSLRLHSLNDAEKTVVLQQRAAQRGLQLSIEVADFILKRCSRQLGDLLHLLAELDQASLQAQRKITIPFVKAVLNL